MRERKTEGRMGDVRGRYKGERMRRDEQRQWGIQHREGGVLSERVNEIESRWWRGDDGRLGRRIGKSITTYPLRGAWASGQRRGRAQIERGFSCCRQSLTCCPSSFGGNGGQMWPRGLQPASHKRRQRFETEAIVLNSSKQFPPFSPAIGS